MDLLAQIAEAELQMNTTPESNSEHYFFCLINLLKAGKSLDLGQLTTLSFPQKLYLLLQFDKSGTAEWCAQGQAFRILHKDKFMSDVVPHYFNQKEFRSFERQLNVYGFGRFRTNESKHCYRHTQFSRDHPELISILVRKPPKYRRGPCKKTVERKRQELHREDLHREDRIFAQKIDFESEELYNKEDQSQDAGSTANENDENEDDADVVSAHSKKIEESHSNEKVGEKRKRTNSLPDTLSFRQMPIKSEESSTAGKIDG